MQNNIKSFLQDLSSMTQEEVLDQLGAREEGLDQEEVLRRREEHGENQIVYKKEEAWFLRLLKGFLDPFVLILMAIALITYFTEVYLSPGDGQGWITILIISSMILISVSISFYQEQSSKMTTDKLQSLVRTRVSLKRRGEDFLERDMEELVPGDIVRLSAGDLIPADLRVLECRDLFINQASLTGESETIEKEAYAMKDAHSQPIEDLINICLMGTIVVSGSARALVVETGNDSYFGSIAQSLAGDRGETSFERGVRSVSRLLIRFMLIMVPIVFLANGLTRGDWVSAFLFSISIAVGLTPEMLPTIVSSNLAKGANSLSKKKIVVKRLSSMQNFGAMDILCTDKTGTLTMDKIVLEKYLNISGQEDERVLRHGFLNSYFQTGLKNLLDLAVIECGQERGLEDYDQIYEKVDEIPFDFERRRMSVVLRDASGKRQMITKGAIEEMLSISSYLELDGRVQPLDQDLKDQVLKDVQEMNLAGIRVLGVAQKNQIPDVDLLGVEDESDMVLIGYMGFLDPPKDTAQPAIAALHQRGVEVKVLTGDNEFVTKKICGDVGIRSDQILLGQDLETMTDQELKDLASSTNIFAKLSPLQKERVLRILQEEGHVVGFLGDGINDAPALRQADVGVSVDTAVDIAKESADMILLEKDLLVLEEGVIEGRRVFGNIVKYIKMTASSNFGNVFSVLVASAFLPFIPMLPLQLLVQNLLYSISQIAIPWDTMDPEYLDEPHRWDAREIARFMVHIGPLSSIFDIITYLVLWYVFQANTLARAPLFHSGWFLVGIVTQTLVVHLLRTEKLPFIESSAPRPLLITTALTIGLGIYLPFSSFGAYIGLVPLPRAYFPWFLGIVLAYALTTELVKRAYIKKFDSWI